eukprot:2762754-Amphidinium_carterae.1
MFPCASTASSCTVQVSARDEAIPLPSTAYNPTTLVGLAMTGTWADQTRQTCILSWQRHDTLEIIGTRQWQNTIPSQCTRLGYNNATMSKSFTMPTIESVIGSNVVVHVKDKAHQQLYRLPVVSVTFGKTLSQMGLGEELRARFPANRTCTIQPFDHGHSQCHNSLSARGLHCFGCQPTSARGAICNLSRQ